MKEHLVDMDKRKCDTTNFIQEITFIKQEQRRQNMEIENHGNHFAMVENFVEKYVPIRIQSTISEALAYILP